MIVTHRRRPLPRFRRGYIQLSLFLNTGYDVAITLHLSSNYTSQLRDAGAVGENISRRQQWSSRFCYAPVSTLEIQGNQPRTENVFLLHCNSQTIIVVTSCRLA